MPAGLGHLLQANPQSVEVDRLLEVTGSSKLLAMLLRFSAAFAADDNHRDLLSVAKTRKRLKELVTGVFRHAKVQQNGVWLMFECESQAALRLTRVDDFKVSPSSMRIRRRKDSS